MEKKKTKNDNGLRNLLIGGAVLIGLIIGAQQLQENRRESVGDAVYSECLDMGGSSEECLDLAGRVEKAI